jgi:hypothetical protein
MASIPTVVSRWIQSETSYGTTVSGGDGGTCTGDGCGTVYKLSRSDSFWTGSILYSFTGGTDGFGPSGGVVFDKKGNLYGITPDGVMLKGCGGIGCGVVYQLKPIKDGAWRFKVVHTFTGGKGGSGGSLGLLLLDGAGSLNGVTELGGAYGAGTVFKLSPVSGGAWKITVLDGFKGTPMLDLPSVV